MCLLQIEVLQAYHVPKPIWDPSKGDSEKIDFEAERKRALHQRYKADDAMIDEQRDWEDKQLHKAVGSTKQSQSEQNQVSSIISSLEMANGANIRHTHTDTTQ